MKLKRITPISISGAIALDLPSSKCGQLLIIRETEKGLAAANVELSHRFQSLAGAPCKDVAGQERMSGNIFMAWMKG